MARPKLNPEDKKIPVRLFLKVKQIDALGGSEVASQKVTEIVLMHLNNSNASKHIDAPKPHPQPADETEHDFW